MANTNLPIASFNCKGHSLDRIAYIKHLSNMYNIVLLQEYWYHSHEISSIVAQIMEQSELLYGRPHGGCAILLKDTLKCKLTPVPISKRCYAGILELNGGTKIFICSI